MFFDYFRAIDDATAIRLMDGLEGGPIAVPDGSVDTVDLAKIEPSVMLGQLVSLARGVDWQTDTVEVDLLWRAGERGGPVLMSLDDRARDTLAAIGEEQMPLLSARWVRIDEFGCDDGEPDDAMLPTIEAIAGLARRARAAGDHLYCWSSC